MNIRLSVKLPSGVEGYFILYRIFYATIVYKVLSRMMSIGDTGAYLNGAEDIEYNLSTLIMILIGRMAILSDFIANALMSILVSYLLIHTINKLELTKQTRWWIYVLLCTPSFSIYTSIISKESICVIGCCLFCLGYFKLLNGIRGFRWEIIFAFLILGLFKKMYLLFMGDVLILLWLYKLTRKQPIFFVIISMVLFIIHLLGFLYLQHSIDAVFMDMGKHFVNGGANRNISGTYLENYIPALFLSFFGQSPFELMQRFNLILFSFFLESCFIVWALCYMLYKCFLKFYFKKRFTGIYIITIFILIFAIMSPQIFYSYFNYGSAARYRNDYILFFIFFIAKFYDNYVIRDY